MSNIALATVTDDHFVAGTIAMLHTFSTHHRQHPVDFYIVTRGLSATNRELLQYFGDVRFVEVSDTLTDAITQLIADIKYLEPVSDRFLSLEFLKLNGYEKVLFCDSDLLFVSNIDDFIFSDSFFSATKDFVYHSGFLREKNTYKIFQSPVGGHQYFSNCFNAGLMAVEQTSLGEDCFNRALGLLDASFFRQIDTSVGLTDQIIYNHLFAQNTEIFPITYNYLLKRREELQTTSGVPPLQAKVLHFNGSKPWQIQQYQEKILSDPLLLPLFKKWQSSYSDAIQYLISKKIYGLTHG